MQKILPLLAIAALSAVATAQFQVVIPAGMATAEGSSSNAFPWGRGGTGILIQTLYSGNNFTSQGINFPIVITGLRWRPNTNVALVNSSYPGPCTVALSTAASGTNATPSTTFATNRGGDYAVCYQGPVSWTAQAAQVGPTPFGISVPLTNSFVYDPTQGDLNIECDIPIQTFTGTGPQLDVHGVSPQASRVFLTTGYVNGGANATGTITANHGVVVQIDYSPANGLFAGFNANVTSGPSPLAVNFTDNSFSSAPGGVTSWAWDLDGDGITDSNLQNPSFVYNSCGSFNVSLTVTDGVNPPSTLTRNAFINTDRIQADFTSQLVGPLVVQFTDTSNMPATSWAWDLDGDGITDSTAQNPAWVYPNTQPVNVSLTVTRLCAPASTITKAVRAAQELSHNVAANNGLSSGASVYFDLNVLNPAGLSIGSMDIIGSIASTAFTVEMWVKPGTHVGFEGTAAEWVRTGIASGTTVASTTLPSLATFPQALYLPPGLHGVKLRYLGVGPRYQNLTATTTVGNADATLTLGVSRGSTVADPWAGANIALRAFSGTLFYTTHNIAGLAGFGQFATGCNGSLPKSELTGNLPQLGQTLTVNANNLPQSLAIMMIGFSNTASGFGPLPLSLVSFGAPGCFGRVSPDATTFLIGAGNNASWSFSVPAAPALSGLRLFQQALVLDPAANPAGLVTSNAAAFQLGN